MKYSLLFTIVLILMGCKSASSQVADAPKLTAGAGQLIVRATVEELPAGPTTHCGQSIEHLAQMNVVEVLEYGAGITRIPQLKTVIAVQFFMGYGPTQLSDEIKVVGVKPGDQVEMQLREKPCFGSREVYYQVFNYRVLP